MTAQYTRPASIDRLAGIVRGSGRRVARAWAALVNRGQSVPPVGAVVAAVLRPATLTVEGWAAAPAGVESVWLTVDGKRMAPAMLLAPEGLRVGVVSPYMRWQVEASRDAFELGVRSIGATVRTANGGVLAVDPVDVRFTPHGRIGSLDQPAEGSLITGNLAVRGWFVPSYDLDRVEVTVGTSEPVTARLLSFPRPDVAGVLRDPLAVVSGWDVLVPPGSGVSATLPVFADAVGPAGRVRIGETWVRREPRGGTVKDPRRVDVLAARVAMIADRHQPATAGLHVFVATHHLGLGGGQLYLQELLRRLLAEPDLACTVFSCIDGVLRDELEDLGVNVHVVGSPPGSGVEYEEWLHRLTAMLVGTDVNTALANTAGCYWGVDLADRLGLTAVWAIHESFPPAVYLELGLGSPDNHVETCFRRAFSQASAVVFEADATLDLFDDLIRPGRGHRVDYGIDLERIRAFMLEHPREGVRQRLNVRSDQTLLMCMGTFEPRKAQALLAAGFARVAERHGGAVLAMVGDAGGPYSDAVHEVVSRLGLAGRVRLVPVTADIEDWYLAADAFILASDVESLPRSMLEAMAFGTPVIASGVFGVPEVVKDGVNGFLLQAGSVGEVAEAMERALSLSSERLREIGAAGRTTVEKNRGADLYAREYRDLLVAAARERRSRGGRTAAAPSPL